MLQRYICLIIICFLKHVKSKVVKNLVYLSFILNIIAKLSTTYENSIMITSYILYFISIIILLKEKILSDSNEAYKPLKFIFIGFGIFNLIFSVLCLNSSDIYDIYLPLIGAFMSISVSCFDIKEKALK
ncbi:hypothetical protein [[Clostridium] colinum]|uniref:hypothetical protein n=1 Tax=[Clostridium] colinum TaxID=36835 RepID=UPI0020252B05|nr:hypothetical protein [[Clostridium] colinum]